MTVLLLTPTTDTVWGWLILAIIALVVGAGALALWEVIVKHLADRRAWEAEVEEMRRAAGGDTRCVSVDLGDGRTVRVRTDKQLTAVDVEALRILADWTEEAHQ